MVKKSGKKFIPILSGIVLVVVAIAVIILKLNAREGYRSIVVMEVSGIVSVVNNGIEYKAYEGMHLMEGYEVITSGESYVRMVLDDDKYVKLESGSRLILETLGVPGSGKTAMRLDRGSMTSEIVKPLEQQEEFIINTPNAVLAVRGTFFRVNIGFTDKGEVSTDILTYGGAVASKRVMPSGAIVEEDVIIEAGFKTKVNMDDVETVYVVETVEKDEETGEITVKKCVPIVIDEDISDDDLVDIFFASDNGHEMFIDKEVIKEKIDTRGIDMAEKTSVYDKAESVMGSGEIEVADDSKPLILEAIETDDEEDEYIHGAPFDGGHTHKKIETVTDADCIVPGKITVSCDDCGVIISETEIPATGHTQIHGGIENCHDKCSVCGTIISAEHTYTQEVSIEPTCLEMGEMTHICECGYSYTTEIPAAGHISVNGASADGHSICESCGEVLDGIHTYTQEVTLEPTCTETGVITHSCECGYIYTTEIPATGHMKIVGSTADCHILCQICNAVISAEHTYTEDVTLEAACDTDGEIIHTCECGYSYTSELAAKGHTSVNVGTADVHSKCSVCGEVISTSHSYTDTVTLEPTCTDKGIITHTCDCGYSYTTEIAENGHTTVNGGTADAHFKCDVCDVVLSTAHSYSSEITLEPTCTEAGVTTYTCECGHVYTEAIEADGHIEMAGGTGECHTKCSVCQETLSDIHTMNESTITAATCKTDGELLHTCDCGYEYTTVIDSTGHTKAENKDVTTCSTCGRNLIALNSSNFPDEELLAYLTGGDIDSCSDDMLDTDELTLITKLVVPEGVTDLTGVELLSSMTELDLSNNTTLTNVSISGIIGTGLTITGGSTITGVSVTNSSSLATLDITGLSNVKTVDVSGMSVLTGLDVSAFAGKLESLNISNSGITELDIQTFNALTMVNASGCAALTSLNVSGCSVLTGLDVTGCPKLTEINVNSTLISEIDLTAHPLLTTVNVGYTTITALDLTNLTQLETLDVSSTDITALNVTTVAGTLKTLKLDYCDMLTSVTWPSDGTVMALEKFNAYQTGITNISLNEIFENLQMVYVGGGSLTSFEYIESDTSKLADLSISSSDKLESIIITDNGADIPLSSISISDNTVLKTLSINNCSNLTSATISNNMALETIDLSGCDCMNNLFFSKSSVLSVINLSGCSMLNNLDVTQCTGLTDLNISGTMILEINLQTNTALKNFIAGGSELNGNLDFRELTAIETINLHDTEIYSLNVSNLTALKTLTVTDCFNLNYVYAEGCTALQECDFTNNTGSTMLSSLKITNTAITDINSALGGCTSIYELTISGNTGITSLDVSGLPNLTILNINGCTGITSLDVSGAINLSRLDIGGTGITNIDMSGCMALVDFLASGSALSGDLDYTYLTNLSLIDLSNSTGVTSLDVSNISTLHYLILSGCSGVTTLNTTGCTGLWEVAINGTQISTVSMANYTSLISIEAAGCTKLTSIDVTGCTEFAWVVLEGCTALQSLKLNGCTKIRTLDMSGYDELNSLTYLDVRNNSNLTELNLSALTELTTVDVDMSDNLTYIDISNTKLSAFDSSAMSNVKIFMCMYATNLTSIPLGNATTLSTLNVTGCSSALNIDLSESSSLYSDYANSIIGYADTMTVY